MKTMRYKTFATVLLSGISLFASRSQADVSLPAIFSDNMVLQRGVKLPVWGTASVGEKVAVTLGNKTAETTADANGAWKVQLDPMDVGEALAMTVVGKNTIAFKNVLIGEVWICSGQSNMEMSVGGCINAPAEISSATDKNIRLFTVQKAVAGKPAANVVGKWEECSPQNVGGFSGVGYFFGRKLREDLKVPIGLIHTFWGGTPAEAWTSTPSLLAEPSLAYLPPQLDKAMENYPKQKAEYEQKLAAWQKELDEAKAEEEKLRKEAESGKVEKDPKADGAAELEGKAKPAPAAPKRSSKAILESKPNAPGDLSGNPWNPAGLYNAMLAPLAPYAIRGATWYQGESNAGRAFEYRTLMPTMIKDWRKTFGGEDFTFLIVQLANFTQPNPNPGDSDWAELREAQFMTTKAIPKVGIGTAIDIGDAADIHPKNKQEVGRRLALQAEVITYGMKDVVDSGPLYDSMAATGGNIKLKFTSLGGGLVAKDNAPLKGFQIAGEDKKWSWADAKIEGDTVVVHSDAVANPVAVRYGWANNPSITLYNKAGLPALPFRTDDWPGVTVNNKR